MKRIFNSLQMKQFSVLAIFALLFVLASPPPAHSYNWPWDQGHDQVIPEDGDENWDDEDGEKEPKMCCMKDCGTACSVYVSSGQLNETYVDLSIPGIGPALQISRTYNSQDWSSSMLGHGWTFNFGRKLIITRTDEGDKQIGVLLENGEKNFYRELPDGTLERITIYGATYELTKNADNTYTILENDGTSYELKEDGKISRIVDRNLNALVFSYNSVGCISRITNASGNYVDFILGPNGKIASVTDNLGRTIIYGYDDNGNLVLVTDPLGNAAQYVYNSNNRMSQVIDARGNVIETITYDNNQPPRVATFTEKGEIYTMAYFVGYTQKTDSQGNRWTYYYNDAGVIERIIDPFGNEKKQYHNKLTATSFDWEEDQNGNRTTYTYDAAGNMTSQTDPLGNTTSYTYVAGTDLVAGETDPLGSVTTYEYDAYGNLTRLIRDSGGILENATSYTYDSAGNETSVTDSLGNTTRYEYDNTGNLIREIDPLGNTITYTYDNRGNNLTKTDALGNVTTYTYDMLDRMISETDPLGGITSYSYDANGNQVSETDAKGNTKTFGYDPYNRLIQEINPIGNTTAYSYDSRDNIIQSTEANGNTTNFSYNILNYLARETNVLGGQTNYIYDTAGNVLSVIDANGNTTTFTYDSNNRLISELNAAGETTTYSYDNGGNLISVTSPNGNVFIREFDTLGRISTITDSLGLQTSYTYDSEDNLIAETDALGNSINFNYDATGRLVQQTDALGNSTSFSYNANGNLIIITDRQGNTVRYTYDALSQKISKTDQLGNTTTYTYDSLGNLISATDANGNTTSYSYDATSRLTVETFADSTIISYSYDVLGNLITRTDQNDQITNYAYDGLNRKVTIDYPGSNDSTFSYDAVGNLLSANNLSAVVSFAYDNRYRLTQESQNGQAVSYSYNTANRTKNITYPNGKSINEVRNVRNQLTQVVDSSSSEVIASFSFDAGNRLLSKSFHNGHIVGYTYDVNGRITELNYSDGSTQVTGYQYGYDQEDNRLFTNKLHDSTNSEQYIYDPKYRLVLFKQGILDSNGSISALNLQKSYNLDALGNWESIITNGIIQARTHNEMNEISIQDGVAYTYDGNGNLIDDYTNTYEYDYENRLIRVTRKSNNQVVGEYAYDALGRRVEKQASGITTNYYYDGNRVIEERINDITDATYIYGSGIDEVLSMGRDGQTFYYHTDLLGSIVALTDTSGNILEQYDYDAYGASNITNSAFNNPYMYTARRLDNETNLYYYRARYYSTLMGRFLQRDPVGYEDGMNLYEYVGSNPINRIDPLGLSFIARGSRKVKGFGLVPWTANHLSIEYFEEDCPKVEEGKKFSKKKIPKGAKRSGDVELLNKNKTFGYMKTNYYCPSSNGYIGYCYTYETWEYVGISVIYFNGSDPKDFKVLYSDKSGNNDSLAKWNLIKEKARKYKYAEQSSSFKAGVLKNWPNSKYFWPPGNNSNTFGREMGRVIGKNAGGVGGWPGASSPKPVKDPGYTPVIKQ